MSVYRCYWIVGTLLIAGVLGVLVFAVRLGWLPGYLIAVNLVTFAGFGFDKAIAGSAHQRVPERVLHGFSLLGGSPGALAAQRTFRHKTAKASFQRTYWVIVAVQIGLMVAYFWWF